MQPGFIDHIVVVVKDVEATKNFYSKFLGDLEHSDDNQIVYKIGETKLFLVAADGGWASWEKDRGGLNHLAFGVHSVEELKEFEQKLNDGGIANSGIQIDKYGKKEFIWLDDPSGIRLEIYNR